MVDAQADIRVNITANDQASKTVQDFNKNLNQTGNQASETATKFEQFTKAVVFGNVIYSLTSQVAIRIKDAFHEVTDAAKVWQEQQSQLNQSVENAAGRWGIASDKAIELAENMEKITPISKESTLAAENQLMTFTHIGAQAFPLATKAVADLATRLNNGATPSMQQMSDTAIMLGKALDDPIANLTALHRRGVDFTEQQKEQIKTMMDAGNTFGAQKIILDEVAKEYGGSATAAARTFRGEVEILRNRVLDLGEGALTQLVTKLTELFNWYENNKRAVNDIAGVIIALGGAILVVVSAYKTWELATLAVTAAQEALNLVMETNPIVLIITGIIAAVILLVMHFNTVKQVAEDVWHSVAGFFQNLWGNVVGIFDGMVNGIKSAFGSLVGAISYPFKLEFDVIARAWNATLGKLSVHVPSWVPGIGGKGFDFPQIPVIPLAQGGIVPAKPGGTLALIGEAGQDEAVIPLPKNSTQTPSLGGKTTNNVSVNITVTAQAFMGSQMQARQFAQQIFQALQDYAASKNTTVAEMVAK